MAEPTLRIRCPGCQSAAEVSLAVGQQLMCDTCGTRYLAPVISPEEMEDWRTSDTEFDVVGDPWRGFRDLPSAPTRGRTPPAGRAGMHALPDLEQTREWQTVDWPQQQEEAREVTKQVAPLPGGKQGNESPASAQFAVGGATEDVDLGTPSALHFVISFVSIAVIGACLGGAAYVMHAMARNDNDREAVAEQNRVAAEDASEEEEIRWIDASRAGQQKNRVLLKVERATYGSVRAKDLDGRVITTDDDNLLAIVVSVRNRNLEARGFQSWYGRTFDAGDNQEVLAELIDDQKRTYQMLKYDDVSSLEGQRLSDQIQRGQEVQDTLVFMLPRDVDRKAIQYFRLALPAKAVGLDGWYRFQIPVSMISGY